MSGSTPSMGGLVVTHHVRVDPSRSMKSVTGDVQSLLAEYGEGSRRSCALLASELIAQIVGREPSWAGGPVGLTIQLRKDAIRMEATAPTPASRTEVRMTVSSTDGPYGLPRSSLKLFFQAGR
jgi:hypothetical protein